MKFESHIAKSIIPEWKHYYINYKIPSKLLRTLRPLRRRINFRYGNCHINNLTDEERQYVANSTDHFKQVLKDQIEKFEDFLIYKIEFSLKPTLLKIIYNIKNLKGKSFEKTNMKDLKARIKEDVKHYYKEVNMVKQYLNLNLQIFYKLTKKYKKEFTILNSYSKETIESLNECMKKVNVQKLYKILERYAKVVETIFIEQFFKERQYKEAYDELNKLTTNDQFTKTQSFTFGLYLGSFVVSAIICVLLLIETNFFSRHQSEFVIYQFPIFRGALVLYLYIFLLGVDVYVWEQYNINYKNVFALSGETSSAFQIMKRAFGFLAIWALIFGYCALSSSEDFDRAVFFDKTSGVYLAPFVWFVFIFYIFFPSKKHFAYESRIYIFKVFKNVLIAPFTVTSLSTNLAIDQFLSFTVVIKDFLYTLCYTDNVIDVGKAVNTCQNRAFKRVEMVIILTILFWKISPGFGKLIRLYRNKPNMTEAAFKLARYKGFYGLFRGSVGMTMSIISYHMANDVTLFYIWLVLMIFTTVSSYYSDLADDWGFLQTKNLLREKLSYPKKVYYYIAIVLNVIFRVTWTMSLSPSLLKTPLIKNMVTLLSSLLECIRRMIWNFIKVEFEHLKLEGNFNAVPVYDFPFEIEIDMSNPEIAKTVHVQVNYYLKKAFLTRNHEVHLTDTDFFEKLMSQFNDQSPLSARVTNMTLRRQSSLEWISEVEEKRDLEEYDKSLQHCLQFIYFMRKKKLGSGVAKIQPDFLIQTAQKNKTIVESNREISAKTVLGETQAKEKVTIFDSELIAVDNNIFKQQLLDARKKTND